MKAVRLPEGKDPADIASTNHADFAKRVADATSIVEFFLGVLAAGEHDSHKLVLAAEETVLPLIAAVQSPLEQEHFIGLTARALAMPTETIRSGLRAAAERNKIQGGNVVSNEGQRSATPASGNGGYSFSDPSSYGGKPRPAPLPKAPTSTNRGELLLAVIATYSDNPLAEKLKTEYSRIIGAPVPDEPLPERAPFEAGLAFGELPTESEISDLVRMFEYSVLTEKLHTTTQALRRAELSGDSELTASLVATCEELSKKLSAF